VPWLTCVSLSRISSSQRAPRRAGYKYFLPESDRCYGAWRALNCHRHRSDDYGRWPLYGAGPCPDQRQRCRTRHLRLRNVSLLPLHRFAIRAEMRAADADGRPLVKREIRPTSARMIQRGSSAAFLKTFRHAGRIGRWANLPKHKSIQIVGGAQGSSCVQQLLFASASNPGTCRCWGRIVRT
jgi:hypothetical protein